MTSSQKPRLAPITAHVTIFDPELGRTTCTTDRWSTQYDNCAKDAIEWAEREIESDARYGRLRHAVVVVVFSNGTTTSRLLKPTIVPEFATRTEFAK